MSITSPSGSVSKGWSLYPRLMLSRGWKRLANAAFVLTPTVAGAVAVWGYFDRMKGVRLMGGLVPGLWVAAGLALLVTFLLIRYRRPVQPVERKRSFGLIGATALGRVLTVLRFTLLGALVGAVLLRSFHPVRANTVYVVIELADPVNDKQFCGELLATAAQILREHSAHDVKFVGTERLGEFVRSAADGKLNGDDQRWWDELVRQDLINERLSSLERSLADYVGETVCVVSVNKPTGRVSPWPLSPERIVCRWYCVDPSQAPRADRTQLVSYSVGQDPAAAPKFYATLSVKPGEPAPKLRTQMTGESPKLHPSSGRYGDYFGYEAALPRNKSIAGIEFEKPDGTTVSIASLKDLKLAPRRLRVKAAPGLERLRTLPFIKETDGPIEYVDANPDVTWVASKAEGSAASGSSVEVVFSPNDYTSAPQGYQLRRTNGYMKSALGQVGLPNAGAEFRDLGHGVEPSGQVLVGLGRDAGDDLPVVFHRAAERPGWVTIVFPRVNQFDLMSDNVARAMSQLLIWSTSLARREGRMEPVPVLTELLIDRPDEVELPARSGPEPVRDSLGKQLMAGLRGRLDGNRHLSAANSLRGTCGLVAAAAAAALLALTLIAALLELWVNRGRVAR